MFALIALILFVRVPARPDTRPLHVEVDLPPDVEYFSGPSLSADGTRLALVGVRVGARQVYMRSLDDTEMRPVAVLAAETGGDIYTTPVDGGEVKPLLVTKAYEGGAQVSPDGRWMTYISNESGRMEVFLRPFGAADRRWPVSTDGGLHALWSPDGRQIFYRSGQQLLVVDVTTTPEVRLSAPRLLFDRRYAFGQNLTIPNYSLSGDGREFLMVQEEAGGRHMNLVLNWLQGLERRPDIK